MVLSGSASVLTSEFYPPIRLTPGEEYSIGLLSLETYNSIPNIEEGVNNLFHFQHGVVRIPTGTYEVDDLRYYIQNVLEEEYHEKELTLKLHPNRNTLKTELKANFDIDFGQPYSIGPLLGFTNHTLLKKNTTHESDRVINIQGLNTISVECDLVTGSYKNGQRGRSLYSFYPSVEAGYKIIEAPSPVIYLPLNKATDQIQRITVSVVDENNRPVSFRGETVTVRLHLKNGY